MKKLILFVFVLVGYQNILLACSCNPGYSFCYTTTHLPNDLIVSGELTYVDTTKARLKIIDIFKGTETNDTITIWAGTGHDCNGWVSMSIDFGEIGDTIVIILPRITSTNIENVWDVAGDYRRPQRLCLTPVLKVSDDEIICLEGDGINSIPYPPPSWRLNSMNYLDFVALWDNGSIDCSTLIGIEENESNLPLKLFPNPATEKISIELPPNSGALSSVVISDIAGNVALRATEAREIDVSTLSPGIYFVLAETDKFVFRQKLVKH